MSLTPERIKELDDQVREIGKHLGMEFDEEERKRRDEWSSIYWAGLISGDKRISFSTSNITGKTRLFIRPVFPRDQKGQYQTPYNAKHPEITVAMDRGPEKIAHAIQSRLLPEYEKQLVIVLENIAKSDAYHAMRMETLKTIAEYFSIPIPEDDDKAIYPPIDGGLLGIYKIEADSEGVKFDVSTTVKKALQIFEILRKEEEGLNRQYTDDTSGINE